MGRVPAPAQEALWGSPGTRLVTTAGQPLGDDRQQHDACTLQAAPGAGMRTIFVFGSNRQGRHGAGAAACARRAHGAIYGQAAGLQGDSYAIVTKELRAGHPPVLLAEVATGVQLFLDFAGAHKDWNFLVTAIGCGLAGFKVSQIAPLFCGASSNVQLPAQFKEVLEGVCVPKTT